METLRLTFGAAAMALAVQSPTVGAAPACPLTLSFQQADVDPVWDDKLKKNVTVTSKRTVLFDSKVLVFSERMAVDADGSGFTYSAKDPLANLCNPKTHPENVGKDPVALGCAMDKLCYGVKMRVPDGQGKFKIIDHSNCSAVAAAFTKAAQAKDWKPADGTRIDAAAGIEMKDEKERIPCIDANNAYLVSKTIKSGVEGNACDQYKWLDPMVPFIVVPQCWLKSYRTNPKKPENAKLCEKYLKKGSEPDLSAGDLVAVMSRNAGDSPILALIGDAGPNGKLGEASIGLLMKSEGKTERPTYVAATDWYDRRRQFDIVIFRDSRYTKPTTPQTYGEIEAAAQDKFKDWGSGDQNNARALLSACGLKASP